MPRSYGSPKCRARWRMTQAPHSTRHVPTPPFIVGTDQRETLHRNMQAFAARQARAFANCYRSPGECDPDRRSEYGPRLSDCPALDVDHAANRATKQMGHDCYSITIPHTPTAFIE